MTFYLCKGTNPACEGSLGCFVNGGNCIHTSHEEHALTPPCKDPQNHPERFEAEVFANLPTYYFERRPEIEEPTAEENGEDVSDEPEDGEV